MPNSLIKSYSERSGKSVSEIEKMWDEAKVAAHKKFKNEDSRFWAYVNTVVRKQLGLKSKLKEHLCALAQAENNE